MKKILAILLAALMVFSLAACSTSGTPEKADEPQAPAQGEPEAEEEQLETASASSDENGVLMVYRLLAHRFNGNVCRHRLFLGSC